MTPMKTSWGTANVAFFDPILQHRANWAFLSHARKNGKVYAKRRDHGAEKTACVVVEVTIVRIHTIETIRATNQWKSSAKKLMTYDGSQVSRIVISNLYRRKGFHGLSERAPMKQNFIVGNMDTYPSERSIAPFE